MIGQFLSSGGPRGRILRGFFGALVAALLAVILPAVISGAPPSTRTVLKDSYRKTVLTGAEAKAYMARQHASDKQAKAAWEHGKAHIEGNGRRLNDHLLIVHVEKVVQYAPSQAKSIWRFIRELLGGTVNAQTVDCNNYPELNPDECDTFYWGDVYYDDYDISYNAVGWFTETVTVTAQGGMASTLDVTWYTSALDPWDFNTLDYSVNGADFYPDDQQIPKPPPEHTFHGIPCSHKGEIGIKIASMVFEKGAIAAGAGALIGLMGSPAGAIGGALIGFNATGASALIYYQTEYEIVCRLKWGNSHHLLPEPQPAEIPLGVKSWRP